MGWDIGFVRQQLGYDDYGSIERYVSIVKNEEVALRMQPPAEADAGGKDQAPGSPVLDEMEISKIRGEIASRNPDAVLLNGLDAAIIGVTVGLGESGRVVYDLERMLHTKRNGYGDNVPDEEAFEKAEDDIDYSILSALPSFDAENFHQWPKMLEKSPRAIASGSTVSFSSFLGDREML
jgi:hypothetical protein